MRCPQCDAENSAGMRFCGQCGSPLAAGTQLMGELKQVSVLFCDIVNSTGLAERLGPEAMHELVRSFIDLAVDEVRRYAGTVPQFLGDGFMALFGAPVTHEDHVRRGLLAALAIRQAVETSGQTAAANGRPDFAVRIGIHTGLVVFGSVGTRLRMDPTAIGDTANVASRLQGAADPGTIVISEATHRLAQGSARAEPVGPFNLKGKAEPIPAYRLLGYSDRRTALDAAAASGVRDFVGRDSELATLIGLIGEIEEGFGRAIGLMGEPGIGKSRLLAEFRRRIGDLTWVEGRCLSYGTATPYLLVLDLLRGICGISETDNPEAITEKVHFGLLQVGMDPAEEGPYLLHLLGLVDVGGASAIADSEGHKAKTFEILRRLCLKGSRRRPLVIAIEDLHWIDKVSEEFLASLTEDIPGARILALTTYRSEYRPPWLDKPYADEIPMQPLSREDSLRVVRSVLGHENRADAVTAAIVDKGDGNPFFLEQLALHAGEDAHLRSPGLVPNTIHDVVMARIDRLPEATKRLLQIAAVIGREFSQRLLEAVWPGPRQIAPHLRRLIRLEFLDQGVDSEQTGYVFRHALTQETAYGSLLERHRRVWHTSVAQAIEKLHEGHIEDVAERLALHFGRSDAAEKAVDYAILAAEKSQRRWANGEALNYFDDALRRLDAMPDDTPNQLRRIDAVLKQADVRYALAQYIEHLQALEGIRHLIEDTDEPRRRAAWHYWMGLLHSVTGSRPDIAIEHCREASKIASAHGLDDIDAFAASCLAQAYVVAGRPREAIGAGERALAGFEAGGNRWWATRTLWFLSIAANNLGDWETSLGYCRRGLDHGADLNDLRFRSVQPVGWWRMGATYVQQGDIERGLQCCDEALALAPILPRDEAMAKAVRGYGHVKAGRFDAGIADLSEALAWLDRSGLRYAYLTHALWLAEGHLRRGDWTSAGSLIQDILDTCRACGYLHYEGRACWLMGECVATGSSAGAEDYIESAMQILERIGARNDLARALLTRAALQQRADDPAAARRLLERALALFRQLRTRDELDRAEAALAALDCGRSIPLLAGVA